MHEFLTQLRSVVEFCPLLMALGILAGVLFPGWWPPWLRSIEQRLSVLASRKWAAIFTVGLAALLVRLALLPAIPIPRPVSHDESAYVFGAQTFAAGRIANPSPPLPEFFDAPQIFVTPTYSSAYQPGQSLVLALGIRWMGHPWWAVWLLFGVFCGTVCWALQAWLPRRWAFYGGLIAVVQPGVFYYWVNGYWSSLLPATGGALLVGTAGRFLRDRPSWLLGIPLGLGIAILEMTRIFEGQILIFSLSLVLLLELVRRPMVRSAAFAAMPMAAVVLIAAVIWQGLFNLRVSGDITKVPYVHHTDLYFTGIPFFVFSKPGHHVPNPFWDIDKISTNELDHYYRMHTVEGVLERAREVGTVLVHFGGVPMVLALAAVPWVWRRERKLPAIAIIAAITTGCLFIATPFHPHYDSPAIVVACLLFVEGMRRIRRWRLRSKPVGFFAVRYAAVAALLCVLPALAVTARWNYRYLRGSRTPCCTADLLDKDVVAAELQSRPGKHIVFVRFEPTHNEHTSWIYNEPDLDQTSIIWARDLGDTRNARLLDCYPGRRGWKLNADRKPLQLESAF